MKRIFLLICVCIIPVLLLVSCGGNQQDASFAGMGETFAAYTMQAVVTQAVFQTMQAQLTEVAQKPTETPQPSVTPSPQGSPTTLATQRTMVFPTQPVTKSTVDSCYMASFIADVNIPDGSLFPPGSQFTKTWRMKNVGTCTWTKKFALVFSGGNQMNASSEMPFTKEVKTGETIDLSVNMTAPQASGEYISYWLLQNDKGKTFGWGDKANAVIWVKIKVDDNASASNHSVVYNFAENYCSAGWWTSAGSLACGGGANTSSGSVNRFSSITIEGDETVNLTSLVMIPNDGGGGLISGQYPAFQVVQGDWFQAKVGCLSGYPSCDLTFELSYRTTGNEIVSLGSWSHILDSYSDEIYIPLDSLAGSSVQFILTVGNNGSSEDDYGYWVLPSIWR